MEVGGWVQVSLRIFFLGKSSQNSPKPLLIFSSSIPLYSVCTCTLLKVVGYNDLSVLCSIQFFFLIFGKKINFAKPLTSFDCLFSQRHAVRHVQCIAVLLRPERGRLLQHGVGVTERATQQHSRGVGLGRRWDNVGLDQSATDGRQRGRGRRCEPRVKETAVGRTRLVMRPWPENSSLELMFMFIQPTLSFLYALVSRVGKYD